MKKLNYIIYYYFLKQKKNFGKIKYLFLISEILKYFLCLFIVVKNYKFKFILGVCEKKAKMNQKFYLIGIMV